MDKRLFHMKGWYGGHSIHRQDSIPQVRTSSEIEITSDLKKWNIKGDIRWQNINKRLFHEKGWYGGHKTHRQYSTGYDIIWNRDYIRSKEIEDQRWY